LELVLSLEVGRYSKFGRILVLVQVFNLKVDRQLSREYFTSDAIYNGSAGNDIILLHVQELARLLQEMGEPVLAIRIS
jgi:Mg2+/Co2+ transporter CorB